MARSLRFEAAASVFALCRGLRCHVMQLKGEGCCEELWLLVNIQSSTEFASNVLNRDTWSHDDVRSIVRRHVRNDTGGENESVE